MNTLQDNRSALNTVSFEFSRSYGMWRCVIGDETHWSPSLVLGRRMVATLFPTVRREVVSIDETVDELLSIMHTSTETPRQRLAVAIVSYLEAHDYALSDDDMADLLAVSSSELKTIAASADRAQTPEAKNNEGKTRDENPTIKDRSRRGRRRRRRLEPSA